MTHRRRELLWLLGAGTTSLLASCLAPPAAEPPVAPATPASTLATPASTLATPTSAAATPTSAAATPTSVPATPTSVPATPTAAPPTPTASPTLMPTPVAPPAMVAAIDAAMADAMAREALPGGVVDVRHAGLPIMLAAYGSSHQYEAPGRLAEQPISATSDTLYDLASITKLFTTTAVMRLVEQGALALDTPVARWLPEFAAGGKNEVTLRHLLTHTSGLPDLLRLWELEATPAARLQRVLATPLLRQPGAAMVYSDLGLIAVGHLLETVVGASLDSVVQDLVLTPLHLDQVMYRPPAALRLRIAATEYEGDPDRGMVWGEVDDANAWSLGGVAAHAGLFGTADQLARLAQLYLEGGSLDGVRLLSPETVAEMTRNQVGKLGWRGLGWELNASYYMGRLAGPRTYGHTGFTGTSLVIDPRRELIVVLLTNRVHPTTHGPSINPLRQSVANAALAATGSA